MKWRCTVCGYVSDGSEAPEACPNCKSPQSKFEEFAPSDELLQIIDYNEGHGV